MNRDIVRRFVLAVAFGGFAAVSTAPALAALYRAMRYGYVVHRAEVAVYWSGATQRTVAR